MSHRGWVNQIKYHKSFEKDEDRSDVNILERLGKKSLFVELHVFGFNNTI